MLASALQAGCTAILTEDLDNGRRIDGLIIIDPFRAAVPLDLD